ncbi:hypothetical protein HY310_03620, partial [Candidatus Microgenomates bacterium]|nr:hypothetical protein [Candidatus Microgenomates bacterium]
MPLFWNRQLKIVFSDVDETIAEVYTPATAGMIVELEKLLTDGIILYMVSGASINSINERIVNKLNPDVRKNILVAHCSGAEVWGYDEDGLLITNPYYSIYDDKLSPEQKQTFRTIIKQLINEFNLKTFPPMGSKAEFREMTHYDPLSIMCVDRGPQITFQLTNAYDLTESQAKELRVPLTHGRYDLRYPLIKRSEELFEEFGVPITARTGGTTALDFAVEGISKTTAVHWALENNELLAKFNLHDLH